MAVMRKGMRWINSGIFPVLIAFTQSRERFDWELRKMGVRDANFGGDKPESSHAALCQRFDSPTDPTCLVICMAHNPEYNPSQVIGIIAHEATHAMQYVLDDIGERQPGWETQAYLVQHITQSCYDVWCDNNELRARGKPVW